MFPSGFRLKLNVKIEGKQYAGAGIHRDVDRTVIKTNNHGVGTVFEENQK